MEIVKLVKDQTNLKKNNLLNQNHLEILKMLVELRNEKLKNHRRFLVTVKTILIQMVMF